MDGNKVEVYHCNSHYIDHLISAFEGKPQDDMAVKLMESVKKVEPDCVVFNWECSSGYSGKTFPEGNKKVFKFLRILMDKGHMAMFSDFSLKALINSWDEKYNLGPNPFLDFS